VLYFSPKITELGSKYKIIHCPDVNIALLVPLILEAIDPNTMPTGQVCVARKRHL
jgi:acyl-CoA reductase-like NAD-dependent aldehyde dehydrogenase